MLESKLRPFLEVVALPLRTRATGACGPRTDPLVFVATRFIAIVVVTSHVSSLLFSSLSRLSSLTPRACGRRRDFKTDAFRFFLLKILFSFSSKISFSICFFSRSRHQTGESKNPHSTFYGVVHAKMNVKKWGFYTSVCEIYYESSNRELNRLSKWKDQKAKK